MKTKALLALLAVPAFAAGLSAQTIYNDINFTMSMQVAVNSTNFPITVAVPTFDTTLGTLQTVTLTLTTTIDGSISIYNFNSTPEGFTGAFSNQVINVTGPSGTGASFSPMSFQASGTAGPASSNPSIFDTLSSTGSSTANVTNLSPYEMAGPGTYDVMVNATAGGSYGGSPVNAPGGTMFFGGQATVGGDLAVTYTYVPIPEPATYAACLGAIALGLAMCRRQRIA